MYFKRELKVHILYIMWTSHQGLKQNSVIKHIYLSAAKYVYIYTKSDK